VILSISHNTSAEMTATTVSSQWEISRSVKTPSFELGADAETVIRSNKCLTPTVTSNSKR
jgi:hypothetical protein